MSELTLQTSLGQSTRRPQAKVEVLRGSEWVDLSDRVLFPVSWRVAYKQLGSAEVTFDNWDGLLSPENEESAFNRNASGEFEPLLDEHRRLRIRAGVQPRENLSQGKECQASRKAENEADTSCPQLTDGETGEAGNPFDGKWCFWQAAPGPFTLSVDLGEVRPVASIALRFLSNTQNGFYLPNSVVFHLSDDGAEWRQVEALGREGYAEDSVQPSTVVFCAHDLEPRQARWVKVEITPHVVLGTTCLVACDELEVLGGEWGESELVPVFAGYLGDEIAIDSEAGTITCRVRDLCKRLKQNYIDITAPYKEVKIESIIENLLVDPQYWPDETPVGPDEYDLAETGFVMPEWQGQSGSLHDFITKLADVVGFVFEVDPQGKDGAGAYVLAKPPSEQGYADLCFHYGQYLQASLRYRSGLELRNYVRVEGPANKSHPLAVELKSSASIARYGRRYWRVSEPLCKTEQLCRALAKALLRDYGWVHESLEATVLGHPALCSCRTLVSFAGEKRTGVKPDELWRVESAEHTLTASDWTCKLTAKRYKPAWQGVDPEPPTGVAGTPQDQAVALAWDEAPDEVEHKWRVYHRVDGAEEWTYDGESAQNNYTVSGLLNWTVYEFAVTCVVSATGAESEKSLPVKAIPEAAGGSTQYAEEQAKPVLALVDKQYWQGRPYSLKLKVTPGDTSVKYVFNLYRSTEGENEGYKLVASLTGFRGGARYYNEASLRLGVESGDSAWYRAALCSPGGRESGLSEAVQVDW